MSQPSPSSTSNLTWMGIALMGLTGLIHLVEAPEYFAEERYIGVLFLIATIGAAISLYGIWNEHDWGWFLGIIVAGGSVVAYLTSRTVGLPGFRENSWQDFLEPSGLFSLIVELLFCVIAIRFLSRQTALRSREPLSSN